MNYFYSYNSFPSIIHIEIFILKTGFMVIIDHGAPVFLRCTLIVTLIVLV